MSGEGTSKELLLNPAAPPKPSDTKAGGLTPHKKPPNYVSEFNPDKPNLGRGWWQHRTWQYEIGPVAKEYRRSRSLGRFPYVDSYFGKEYDKAGLVKGEARVFPRIHPQDRGLYGEIPIEIKLSRAVLNAHAQGKLINVGYVALAGIFMYAINYANCVDSVDPPESFKVHDSLGTACSYKAEFHLPDFALLNAQTTESDSYLKRYTATVFSCWGHYPQRKFAGLLHQDYYSRAYHLHYRRKVKPGEFFTDYELLERDRSMSLLRSRLFGTLAHCHAVVSNEGVLKMQLSTCIDEQHWSQVYPDSSLTKYFITPTVSYINSVWTRFWMTSSTNFFLRYNLNEVYVKPLEAAQIETPVDMFS